MARFILALGRSFLDFIIWISIVLRVLSFELCLAFGLWHLDLGRRALGGQDGGPKLFSYYQRVIDDYDSCAILYTIYTEPQELNPEESKEVRQGYKKDRGYKKARWG